MNIASLLGTSSGAASSGVKSKEDEYKSTKDQFLKLLLAQLKNQDPLSAPDTDKLAEQITAFGQLEQLMNLNKSMDGLSGLTQSYDKSQAISMIGKKVSIEGSNVSVSGTNKGFFGFQIAEGAENVSVQLKDGSGQTVRTINMDNVPAGIFSQAFDGKSNSGADLPDGQYQVDVQAFASGGRPIAAAPLMEGVVSGVDMKPDGIWVTVGGQYYSMGQIISVRN